MASLFGRAGVPGLGRRRHEHTSSGRAGSSVRAACLYTQRMSRILIVEDDDDIAQLVHRYLTRAGHVADIVRAGDEALKLVRERTPDLIILDLMLPGLDGLEVCRALRASPGTRALPIIMLTARSEESDRIVGLELGADDYVSKPFSPSELVARVGALLRRAQRWAESGEPTLNFGSIVLDRERHRVTDEQRDVTLTAKEFLLLEYLLQHRGRVLSRDLLLTDVWGYRYTGGTRTVDVHIRRLREKIPLLADAIETVKQFGYRLIEPISLHEGERAPDKGETRR